MRKILFYLLAVLLLNTTLKAQDKIYRKNGQVVKVKVLEVSSTEIKYKIFGDENGPVYILEKDRIKLVEYENGRTEKPIINLKDPEQYADQMNKAIKIDFLGPLMGYSQISYEKSTGVGKGYELTLGVIGAGKSQILEYYDNQLRSARKNQFGMSVAAGYKFSKFPDFLFGGTRFTHLMQGAYAKPVVYFGKYSENTIAFKGNNQYEVERQNVTFGALQVELGKQWVFGDRFLIDVYWGLGWGADNKKTNGYWFQNNSTAYNYINARVGRSPGFSSSFALKLGLLIN